MIHAFFAQLSLRHFIFILQEVLFLINFTAYLLSEVMDDPSHNHRYPLKSWGHSSSVLIGYEKGQEKVALTVQRDDGDDSGIFFSLQKNSKDFA